MLHFPTWKILAITGACLISILLALPNFIPEATRANMPAWLPMHTVALGLDLQGGSHLLLEVDFTAYLKEQLTNLADETRAAMRKAKLGYRNLSVREGAVEFDLFSVGADVDLNVVLRTIDSSLNIEREGDRVRVAYGEQWQREAKTRVIEQSLEIVDRRVNETGTREPIIQRQGEDRIVLQVPGLADPEHLKNLLGRTAKMTFHLLNHDVGPQDIERGLVPSDTIIVPADDGERYEGAPRQYALQSRVILSGDLLVDAHSSYDENGEPVVAFRFNAAGARKFGEVTAENVGKPFAIVLDGKVITAPVIRSPILGGSGIISGNFTVETANDLSLLLRAGALPAPLKVLEERTVGPSLGSDSIRAGALACLIGTALVVVWMTINYGLFGLFANLAMIINGMIVLALMSLLGATLTLPGIAGIVLTMGMAVDTNVLIYERMREETRHGKSPFAAIESGFRMAFGTIIDSHLTTLSAAIILFYFGTGTVKGFAVTLSIGIACSLFTAVLVTRMMVALWALKVKPRVLIV